MKFIIGLFLATILLSSVFTNFAFAKSANDGKYEILENRLRGTPTFCAFEPEKDPILPESTVPLLMKEAKNSIDVWLIPFFSKKQGQWNINYVTVSRDAQNNFDKTKCNVIILFKPRDSTETEPKSLRENILKNQHYTYDLPSYRHYEENKIFIIEIFYQTIGTCWEREYFSEDQGIDWNWDCRQESTAPIVVIGAIMRHAIGHSFGLGHYQSQSDVSIMSPLPKLQGVNVKTTPDQITIRQVDFDKLKEIYNYEGWGAQPIIVKEIPKKIDNTKKKIVDENKLDKKRTDELKTKKDTKKTEKKIVKPKITKPKSSQK